MVDILVSLLNVDIVAKNIFCEFCIKLIRVGLQNLVSA